MGSIYINVSDSVPDVIKNIDSKVQELPERMVNLVEDIADMYEGFATDEAPVKLGDLQGSIYTENTGLLERLVSPHVDYAIHVHNGYDPFELNSPVNIDGGWVYIKTHPGYEGNPFMERAETRGESYVEMLSDEFIGWLSE